MLIVMLCYGNIMEDNKEIAEQWKRLPKGTPVYLTSCPKWGLKLDKAHHWFCIVNEGNHRSTSASDPDRIVACKLAVDKFLK